MTEMWSSATELSAAEDHISVIFVARGATPTVGRQRKGVPGVVL
ncbi:hypothetical protein [Specibacter sp. NPDC078709]